MRRDPSTAVARPEEIDRRDPRVLGYINEHEWRKPLADVWTPTQR